jgi:hypothetical protein
MEIQILCITKIAPWGNRPQRGFQGNVIEGRLSIGYREARELFVIAL